ncbi:MAG: diaminopimelate decarboxylase [Candidatus Lokiarchaeota archaeon]|nr:diaminopimelate decarboxylase [Candidatus Lokiarchaeota archaeon]
MNYSDWLSRKGLEYRKEILYFADKNTLDIANSYGTPLYVINEQMIRERYRSLKNVLNLEYRNNQINYAVKANSNLSVLKILNSEGASFDCTSMGEVYTCLKAGISSEKIIFTGNMFTDTDFTFAVNNDIFVNLDSLSQLNRLVRVYETFGKEKKGISFRINPEFGAGHHKHTITAGRDIKFGILEEQTIEAYRKAKEAGFEKFGIHQHIGSGVINALDFGKPAEKFISIIEKIIEELDIKFEFIDFGGGLGIPYRPEEEPLDLESYKNLVIKPFLDLVKSKGLGEPIFKIEPGRYLSAESTILLTQINTIKDNGFKLFAGVDAGFNTLIRPTLYNSYHHIIPCDIKGKEQEFEYDVVGPICESGDILGKARKLKKLKEGDHLAILDTGAYGFVMSSPYNSRPRPAEVLINNETVYEIRRAETFDDLLNTQKIPDHLK